MLLSIIIVSYEVKYFLEQCLFSVKAAINQAEAEIGDHEIEIIVIDNASSDGTVLYLQQQFPFVSFLPNKTNVGFGRANNQGIERAGGKYILFLNPDTIIPEDSLRQCISFLQSNPSAGALGVRMIDGNGRFLPESKRGFPTAWRSFCKLSGLSSLFPFSKFFAAYNQGHLKDNAVFPVEVLAGAFMMVRKAALEKTGGFDERFFMYAEDIDLSKRIKDAGFENYYLGSCTILHFKGESTRRDRLYVKRFYEAMNLYVNKHYTGFGSTIAIGFMKAAIGLRSIVAMMSVKEKEETKENLQSARFVGDKNTIANVQNSWIGIGEADSSGTIILCQGDDFNFSSLIKTMEQLPKASQTLVHASGSRSVVGSFNRNSRGVSVQITSA